MCSLATRFGRPKTEAQQSFPHATWMAVRWDTSRNDLCFDSRALFRITTAARKEKKVVRTTHESKRRKFSWQSDPKSFASHWALNS